MTENDNKVQAPTDSGRINHYFVSSGEEINVSFLDQSRPVETFANQVLSNIIKDASGVAQNNQLR